MKANRLIFSFFQRERETVVIQTELIAATQFNSNSRVKLMNRKSIRLKKHEKMALVELYLQRKIPIDQYEHRVSELKQLTNEFHAATGRTEPFNDLLHYMRNQRKNGTWVRFDGNHKKRESRPVLTADEKEALIEICRENVTVLGNGSDSIAYDPQVVTFIAREFADATGRIVPEGDLVAEVTLIRKGGLLPKVEKQPQKERDTGFDDIEDVG